MSSSTGTPLPEGPLECPFKNHGCLNKGKPSNRNNEEPCKWCQVRPPSYWRAKIDKDDPVVDILNIWNIERDLALLRAGKSARQGVGLLRYHCAMQQMQFAYADWQGNIPLPPNPTDCIPHKYDTRLCSRCVPLARSAEGLGNRFDDYFFPNGDVKFKCARVDDDYKGEQWSHPDIGYWSYEREGKPCEATDTKGQLCKECLRSSAAQSEKYMNDISEYIRQETDDKLQGIDPSPARISRKNLEKALQTKDNSIKFYFDDENRVKPNMTKERRLQRLSPEVVRASETFTSGF